MKKVGKVKNGPKNRWYKQKRNNKMIYFNSIILIITLNINDLNTPI